MKITVKEFERKVHDLEGVLIIIRLPARTMVPDYDFERAAAGNVTVKSWRDNRLTKILGEDISVVIIDPTRFDVNLRNHMDTLRARYVS